MHSIKNISSKFSTPWLKLYEATYTFKNKDHKWLFASRKPNISVSNENDIADAVVIVPFIKTDNGYKIIITKEFRVPLRDYEYGFPAGLIENEDIVSSANRELQEETGYAIQNVLTISPVVYSSAGMTDESVQYVFCECALNGKQKLEGTEEIEVIECNFSDLKSLMSKNIKFGAKSWGILYSFITKQEITP